MLSDSSMSTTNYGVQATFTPPPSSDNFSPKCLCYATAQQGNVFLYEVRPQSLLLVAPDGVMPYTIKRSNEQFMTPQGAQSGYIFYKNTPASITTLDTMFSGQDWKSQLQVPIPPLAEKKTPELLWSGFINNGTVSFYLYEYSDKCLVAFTPAILDEQKGAKPWRGLVCPHSPTQKSDGFMFFKSPGQHHSYLKSMIGNIDYESMYKKSTPPVKAQVQNTAIPTQVEPQLILSKPILSGTSTIQFEIYDYRESSIAVFCDPLVQLPGFTITQNLTHPLKGKIAGYSLSKKYAPSINSLKQMLGITNLEELFINDTPAPSTHDPRLSEQSATLATSISSISQPNMSDLPVEVLVRLLTNKLSDLNELKTKSLIGNDMLYYGPEDNVNSAIDIIDGMEILFELTTKGKKVVVLTEHNY